jgi:hypothetical protein
MINESLSYINVKYLTKLYKDFNKKFFNNELGDYSIVVKNNKNSTARVISFGYKNRPETWQIQRIEFNNTLLLSEDVVFGLMLHEMIHVKVIESKVYEIDEHGYYFLQELDRLRKIANFNVPLEHDVTNIPINPEVIKGKEVAVITVKNGIAVYKSNEIENIIDYLKNLNNKTLDEWKPMVFLSDHPELQKYPIRRVFNKYKFSTYQIDDKTKNSIIVTAKNILYKYKEIGIFESFIDFENRINIKNNKN